MKAHVIQAVFILIGFIFAVRLFSIQVADDSIRNKASDIGYRTIYPPRGLVFDRNGEVLVENVPIYDLQVVLSDTREMDTARFCQLLDIPIEQFRARLKTLRSSSRYSRLRPEVVLSQLSAEHVATFEPFLIDFPGFSTHARSVRRYPHKIAAHVLGEIAEVNDADIERSRGYYRAGDFIGRSGLEMQYEEVLRGRRGVEVYLKDKFGRDIGPFADHKFDTLAVAGSDVRVSLDVELQAYGEKLMRNKRGSIVAIEPSTGEILCMISSPTYDPNVLVGRERGEYYKKLAADQKNKPLINRPITARYPPGSTIKPVTGLISWAENATSFVTRYGCTGGGYVSSGLHVGCHGHPYIPNLNRAIQYSCNAYFCHAFRKLLEAPQFSDESEGLRSWTKRMYRFGLGKPTGVDLAHEYGGNVPTADDYDKLYQGYRWKASTVISISIGQGELEVTPLQLANLYAILANRGHYYPPHFAHVDSTSAFMGIEDYGVRQETGIPAEYFELITEGLENVVLAGTARQARVDSISVCGKTGTAENPHGEDHSLFAAFAPRTSPKIAIAVMVENSGFGGTWAAPIAGLMIEYYIKRKIPANRKWHEQRILDANFITE